MIEGYINIYYAKYSDELAGRLYDSYLAQLPFFIQEKNNKYRRWQDRHLHLFGKLLLLAGLKKYGYGNDVLYEIKLNQYSRPFVNGNIDFNISHSGEYVLCAIGRDLRLGIDIEEIKEIDFNDFRSVMTYEQWQDIAESDNPIRSFFKYWTMKESVIKADSRGLSIPLLDVRIKDNKVIYKNQSWYLNDLNLNKRYSAFLATNKRTVEFDFTYIDFYEEKSKE